MRQGCNAGTIAQHVAVLPLPCQQVLAWPIAAGAAAVALSHLHCPLSLLSQDYDRIMGTNLEATYALCQLMQPLLAAGAAGQQQAAAGMHPAASKDAVDQQAAGAAAPAATGGSSSSGGRRPQGDALVVFISSVAGGPLAGRSGSLYAVSKAGLNQLAASLACEWAGAGIRVNSVVPWVTLTELGKQVSSAERAAAVCDACPLQEVSRADSCTRCVKGNSAAVQ